MGFASNTRLRSMGNRVQTWWNMGGVREGHWPREGHCAVPPLMYNREEHRVLHVWGPKSVRAIISILEEPSSVASSTGMKRILLTLMARTYMPPWSVVAPGESRGGSRKNFRPSYLRPRRPWWQTSDTRVHVLRSGEVWIAMKNHVEYATSMNQRRLSVTQKTFQWCNKVDTMSFTRCPAKYQGVNVQPQLRQYVIL